MDFVCKRNRLVCKIDGDSHFEAAGIAHDLRRTEHLGRLNYCVVRFTNDDVLDNADVVFYLLRGALGEQGIPF